MVRHSSSQVAHTARVCGHSPVLLSAAFGLQGASGTVEHPATPHYAPSTIHHAPRTAHRAPCIMHHAPCTMHHAPLAYSATHHAPCATHPLAYHAVNVRYASYTVCLHHAPPPSIIPDPTGTPYLCGCPVRCCTWVGRLLMRAHMVRLLSPFARFPSWRIPVNELGPFCGLSPRVLGILARSHASPGS